ncbi:hypothetical protein ENUP19_0122G0031 [Entamoeba nuttalli]|uniref:Uncharacterized protein n=2 Tax=Entamoeba nuttalli TaxID=412467 RepID=K2H0Y9_ENTNP|nr:hypothetical protein ENU1_066880 [Entamoeba nuttalli P19]EKE41133.1 hypothetical protein ENU1_066880 [Entamoeba nuttalli P19]|eukprot:XP_008856527.1 hypothetical protein ENU1_066880 [Entamoeba nuttalli P19]
MTETIDLFGISLYPNEIIPCSLLKELFIRLQDEMNKKIQQKLLYHQQPSFQIQLTQTNNEIKELQSELINLKTQFHHIQTQQHEILHQNNSVHSITQTFETQQDKLPQTQSKQPITNQTYQIKLPTEKPLSIGIKENPSSTHKNDIKPSKTILNSTNSRISTINEQRNRLYTNTFSESLSCSPSDFQQEVEDNQIPLSGNTIFQNESQFHSSNHLFYSEALYFHQPSQPSYSQFLTNSTVNTEVSKPDITKHNSQNDLCKSIQLLETSDKVLNNIHKSISFFKDYTGKSSYKILFDSNKLKDTNSFPSQIFFQRCKYIKKLAIFICYGEYLFGVYYNSQLIPSGSIFGTSDFLFSITSPKISEYKKFDINSIGIHKLILSGFYNSTERNKLFEIKFKFGSMVICSPPNECLNNEIELITNDVYQQMAISSCIPKSPFKADRIISISFEI